MEKASTSHQGYQAPASTISYRGSEVQLRPQVPAPKRAPITPPPIKKQRDDYSSINEILDEALRGLNTPAHRPTPELTAYGLLKDAYNHFDEAFTPPPGFGEHHRGYTGSSLYLTPPKGLADAQSPAAGHQSFGIIDDVDKGGSAAYPGTMNLKLRLRHGKKS